MDGPTPQATDDIGDDSSNRKPANRFGSNSSHDVVIKQDNYQRIGLCENDTDHA